MDLSTNAADFKLLSKQLKRNEKYVSNYDYFVPLFNQKYFFRLSVYESSSKTV